MQWTELKQEIIWKEGVSQVCDVCNHKHEAILIIHLNQSSFYLLMFIKMQRLNYE